VRASADLLNPSLYGRRSSPSANQSKFLETSSFRLTEHDLDPSGLGVSSGTPAEDSQIQSGLELAEQVLGGSEVESRICSSGGCDAGCTSFRRCLDGDDILGKVGCNCIENSSVEAMVVAEADVIAAQAAVVLND
jgi:hypothetical protein